MPRFTLRGSLGRTWKLGTALPVNTSIDLRYVGPARLSFDPALDRHAGNLLETRLQVGVKLGRVAVGLQATNLLGSEANTFALGNPLRLSTARQFIPQTPRTLGLTLTFLPASH